MSFFNQLFQIHPIFLGLFGSDKSILYRLQCRKGMLRLRICFCRKRKKHIQMCSNDFLFINIIRILRIDITDIIVIHSSLIVRITVIQCQDDIPYLHAFIGRRSVILLLLIKGNVKHILVQHLPAGRRHLLSSVYRIHSESPRHIPVGSAVGDRTYIDGDNALCRLSLFQINVHGQCIKAIAVVIRIDPFRAGQSDTVFPGILSLLQINGEGHGMIVFADFLNGYGIHINGGRSFRCPSFSMVLFKGERYTHK